MPHVAQLSGNFISHPLPSFTSRNGLKNRMPESCNNSHPLKLDKSGGGGAMSNRSVRNFKCCNVVKSVDTRMVEEKNIKIQLSKCTFGATKVVDANDAFFLTATEQTVPHVAQRSEFFPPL